MHIQDQINRDQVDTNRSHDSANRAQGSMNREQDDTNRAQAKTNRAQGESNEGQDVKNAETGFKFELLEQKMESLRNISIAQVLQLKSDLEAQKKLAEETKKLHDTQIAALIAERNSWLKHGIILAGGAVVALIGIILKYIAPGLVK
jgi:hypothetical protein